MATRLLPTHITGDKAAMPPVTAPAYPIGDLPYTVSLCQNAFLGRGAYADVYRCARNVGKTVRHDVAVKVVAFDDQRRGAHKKRAFDVECAAFERLGKKQLIPSLITYFDSTTALYPRFPVTAGYLFLEQLVQPTLEDEIAQRYISGQPFSVGEVFFLLDQVVRAVYMLHAHGVAHHDIKVANISYDRDAQRCVLFDLGLSVCTPTLRDCTRGDPTDFRVSSVAGSPIYMPPEILEGGMRRHSPFAVDVWTLGHILIEMVTSKPFHGHVRTMDALRERVCVTKPSPVEELEAIALEPAYVVFLDVALQYAWEDRASVATLQRFTSENARKFSLSSSGDVMDIEENDLSCSTTSSASNAEQESPSVLL